MNGQNRYRLLKEENVYITMRDGVRIACDIYRPDAAGKFPALLGMCPYTKEKQALEIPPRPFNAELAGYEKGDSEYLVDKGYVHVLADIRGTGHSEGRFDIMSTREQEDGYDVVEWIARQPWCTGNVGMIGISYLAIIQYLVAAQQPPHLKAIFPHDGWGDMYRDISHHGGILMHGWLPMFTQGGSIVSWDAVPASEKMYSKEELDRKIAKLKSDCVVNKSSPLYLSLVFPHWKPTLFDWMVNEFDGPYYWERSAYTKFDKIKIPVFLGTEFHAYPVIMHLPGAFSAWEGIKGPKKLVVRNHVPERPFHEFHDEIVQWYDYWLKGIENGVMDGPPIKIWVRGAERWKCGNDWPLEDTQWKTYYLAAGKLIADTIPAGENAPDIFHHKPVLPLTGSRFPLDPAPDYLTYTTEPLEEDIQMVGPIVLYLYAALDNEDGDLIVKVKDVSPDGSEFVLSRGWLRASLREVDPSKSRPWQPWHPFTRESCKLVVPGEVNEYAIEVRPIANLFKKGHKIKLEIMGCDYPLDQVDRTLDWPVWSHLSYDREVAYRVFHNRQYQSRLIMPIVPAE